MKSIKDLGKRIFGGRLPKQPKEIEEINALEAEISVLSDENLKGESLKLQERVKAGESLDDVLPRAFALARESAKRKLGQRHYDVQLWGGLK